MLAYIVDWGKIPTFVRCYSSHLVDSDEIVKYTWLFGVSEVKKMSHCQEFGE